MADKTESDAVQTSAAPDKKKKILVILAVVIAVALAGAGSFFYIQSVKAKAGTSAEKKAAKDDSEESAESEETTSDEELSDSDEDHEESSDSGKGKDGKNAKKRLAGLLPKDKKVKRVVELQPFIVNLADVEDNRYLRISIGLGIDEEESEEQTDPLLIARVRNALLAVLTSKTSDDILSEEGKAKMVKELLQAARMVVAEPKPQAIYITELLVQR